jgi:hypothetical protein
VTSYFARIVRRYFPVSASTARAVVWLLTVAFVMVFLNVIGLTLGSAVFLAGAGASRLPIAYIAMGVLSLPIYWSLSRVADRFSRASLVGAACAVGIAMSLGLAVLLPLKSAWVPYVAFMFFYFQWSVHLSVLLPSLQSDYLTTVEYKRFTVPFAVAHALGGIAGGATAGAVGRMFDSSTIFMACAVPYLVLAVLVIRGARRTPVVFVAPEKTAKIERLNWGFFARLCRHYPILPFLFGSTFFYILLYAISEYQYFGIYAKAYPVEGRLTSFMGLVRLGCEAIQLLLILFVFRPLLRRFGLQPLSLIYPATSMLSFAAVWLSPALPAALGVQANVWPIETALNQPVHNLNYNAVPHRHLGLARSVCDGLAYAIGLAGAGVVIWCGERTIGAHHTALVGVGLAALFLVIRQGMARTFLRSLVTQLRQRTIPLPDSSAFGAMPIGGIAELEEMLRDEDDDTRALGFHLAARLPNVARLTAALTSALRQTASPNEAVMTLLKKHGRTLPLHEWVRSDDRNLARMAAVGIRAAGLLLRESGISDPVISALLERDEPLEWTAFSTDDATYLFRAAELLKAGSLLSVSAFARFEQFPSVLTAYFAAVAAADYAPGLAEAVHAGLRSADAEVRRAAVRCASQYQTGEIADLLFAFWSSDDCRLRDLAIAAVANSSEPTLARARTLLGSESGAERGAAIAALSASPDPQAGEWAAEWLQERLEQGLAARRWQQRIPAGDPSWQPLEITIEDFKMRLADQVMHHAEHREHGRVVTMARSLMKSGHARYRSNAMEALASLPERALLLPLLRVMEPVSSRQAPDADEQLALLSEAVQSSDAWLRAAAIASAERLGLAPALALSETPQRNMNRLLVLKQIDLFGHLSLEELALLAEAMEFDCHIAGERIISEGEPAHELFVVTEGTVAIVKGPEQQEIATVGAGECFGEMGLFDNSPRSAGAICRKDCALLKLEKNRFVSLARQRPEIALQMCQVLSERIRATSEQVVS